MTQPLNSLLNSVGRESLNSLKQHELEPLHLNLEMEYAARPTFEDFFRKTVPFDPHEWQIRHLCPLLQRLVTDKGMRVAVHGPPQFGKSLPVSKRFPAYALGYDPFLRIILAGYNVTHATEFADVVRQVMRGPEFREMFPYMACRIPSACRADSFSTKARESLRDGQASITAVGLLTGFTGKGADILIIDDPYASPDDAKSVAVNERVWRWWSELAKVRINDDTNVLVMFHRYHEDDFAGRLLAEGGWEYYRFPAIADQNENQDDPTGRKIGELLSPMRSETFLHNLQDHDPQTWLSQFQGRPRKPEGAIVKREWLHVIEEDELPALQRWVRFWDLSSHKQARKGKKQNDFTAGGLVGVGPDGSLYIKDMTRFREEWPDARELIEETTQRDLAWCRQMARHWGGMPEYDVGIEDVFWQAAMLQDLVSRPVFNAAKGGTGIRPLKPEKDKKTRALGWIARAKCDQLYLVKGPWNQDFINECLAFDGSEVTADDQVDTLSGAYQILRNLTGDLINEKPAPTIGSLAWMRQLREINRDSGDEYNADFGY